MAQTEEEAMQAAFAEKKNPSAAASSAAAEPVKTPAEIESARVAEEIKNNPPPPPAKTAEEIEVEKVKNNPPPVKTAEQIEAERLAAEVKPKTFEEEISERTAGKFKTFAELEAKINTPAEELDEELLHWRDLKKKGIKLDKEFFELQNLNLDKDEHDPEEILMESMKRKPEFKGLPEATLKRQIDKKYNLSEWIDKAEADLTDDDLDNKALLMRDAQNDLEWLKNYKQERTFVKEPDQATVALNAQNALVAQQNWDNFVDSSLVAKTTNLTVVIDGTTNEAFDYKVSEADRKEIGNLMKSLTKDGNALFNQYNVKGVDGKISRDHQRLFTDLLKAKAFDEAVKNSYSDGKAVGGKTQIEAIKNVSFKAAEGQVSSEAPSNEAEAIREAMAKQKKKF